MDQILNILGSVGFNWHVALANFVNFLIILFLLNKFFFKKLGKTISERHEIIERGLNNASEAEKALLRAEEERSSILKDARKEGDSILVKAKENADAVALSITENAEKEADSKRASLLKMEQTLEERMEKEFSAHAPTLVAKLYAKTLAKEMTTEENSALIARMSV